MKLSDIAPLGILKTVLVNKGVDSPIYIEDKPTANIPDSYIELFENGPVSSNLSKHGLITGYILLSVNIRLLSTGAPNKVKRDLLIKKFDDLFEDNKSVYEDGYIFQLDSSRIVYTGSSIYEGFSTRLINIKYNKSK